MATPRRRGHLGKGLGVLSCSSTQCPGTAWWTESPRPLPAGFLSGSANRRQQEGISDKEAREIGVLLLCLSNVSPQVAVSLTLSLWL